MNFTVSKNKEKSETKQYYTVKLEVIAPVTLTYRVLAESPEEAFEIFEKSPFLMAPRIEFSRMKKIKASIAKIYSNLIDLVKYY